VTGDVDAVDCVKATVGAPDLHAAIAVAVAFRRTRPLHALTLFVPGVARFLAPFAAPSLLFLAPFAAPSLLFADAVQPRSYTAGAAMMPPCR
jgi:hypothetical protein